MQYPDIDTTPKDGWPEYNSKTVGPALVKDVKIYRNMVYKNGFVRGSTPAEDVKAPPNVGENAISIRSVDHSYGYTGSFEDVWVVNNTISNNSKYGVAIRFNEYTSSEVDDYGVYHFSGLRFLNNILALNTGDRCYICSVDFVG